MNGNRTRRHPLDIEQYRVLQCITPQWSPGIDVSPINICYRFRQIPAATPNFFEVGYAIFCDVLSLTFTGTEVAPSGAYSGFSSASVELLIIVGMERAASGRREARGRVFLQAYTHQRTACTACWRRRPQISGCHQLRLSCSAGAELQLLGVVILPFFLLPRFLVFTACMYVLYSIVKVVHGEICRLFCISIFFCISWGGWVLGLYTYNDGSGKCDCFYTRLCSRTRQPGTTYLFS